MPVGHLQGSTYGGQQPIWQSHVYLMKASTSGYKSTSTSILTSTANTFADTTVMGTPSNPAYYVVTNGYGNFDITGDYSCTYNATTPSQSDQLYLVSLGGNATYLPPMSAPTGGATNAYIGLMSVLGQCPSNGTFAGHISFIYMNEVSTVAAAYSLAGFAGSSTTVGSASSSQSQLGLANAFANANQLYDITGSAAYHEARQTTPGGSAAIGGVVPYKLIDTLANVLARCINQGLTAAVPTSGACQTLYTLNGNAPDAASAMIYIAQHPTKNVAALYALQGSTGQEFVDSLTSQPNDFSVGINYVGTSTANPLDIAIDGSGYAWVTSGNGAVLKLTPSGTHATGSPFNLPNAGWVSIDPAGNAWVTAGSIVYEMTPTGGNVTASPFVSSLFASGLSKIVTDNTGAYVANPNYGVSLATIVSTGNVMRIVNNAGVPTYSTYYNGVTNVLIPGTTLNNIPNRQPSRHRHRQRVRLRHVAGLRADAPHLRRPQRAAGQRDDRLPRQPRSLHPYLDDLELRPRHSGIVLRLHLHALPHALHLPSRRAARLSRRRQQRHHLGRPRRRHRRHRPARAGLLHRRGDKPAQRRRSQHPAGCRGRWRRQRLHRQLGQRHADAVHLAGLRLHQHRHHRREQRLVAHHAAQHAYQPRCRPGGQRMGGERRGQQRLHHGVHRIGDTCVAAPVLRRVECTARGKALSRCRRKKRLGRQLGVNVQNCGTVA